MEKVKSKQLSVNTEDPILNDITISVSYPKVTISISESNLNIYKKSFSKWGYSFDNVLFTYNFWPTISSDIIVDIPDGANKIYFRGFRYNDLLADSYYELDIAAQTPTATLTPTVTSLDNYLWRVNSINDLTAAANWFDPSKRYWADFEKAMDWWDQYVSFPEIHSDRQLELDITIEPEGYDPGDGKVIDPFKNSTLDDQVDKTIICSSNCSGVEEHSALGTYTLASAAAKTVVQTNWQYGQTFVTSGKIRINEKFLLNNQFAEIGADGESFFYHTIRHELCHLFGISSLFFDNSTDAQIKNAPIESYTEAGVTKFYYTGLHGLNEYKSYISDPDILAGIVGIPLEDAGGSGTAGSHFEEGYAQGISENNRMINGSFHPGLDNELMTGIAEDYPEEYVSRITLGVLKDLGWIVNMAGAEPYQIVLPPTPTPTPTPESTPTLTLTPLSSLPYAIINSGDVSLRLEFNFDDVFDSLYIDQHWGGPGRNEFDVMSAPTLYFYSDYATFFDMIEAANNNPNITATLISGDAAMTMIPTGAYFDIFSAPEPTPTPTPLGSFPPQQLYVSKLNLNGMEIPEAATGLFEYEGLAEYSSQMMTAHTYRNPQSYMFWLYAWSNGDCGWVCNGSHALIDPYSSTPYYLTLDQSSGTNQAKHSHLTSEGASYDYIKVCETEIECAVTPTPVPLDGMKNLIFEGSTDSPYNGTYILNNNPVSLESGMPGSWNHFYEWQHQSSSKTIVAGFTGSQMPRNWTDLHWHSELNFYNQSVIDNMPDRTLYLDMNENAPSWDIIDCENGWITANIPYQNGQQMCGWNNVENVWYGESPA